MIKFGRKKGQKEKIDVAFPEESTSRLQCTFIWDPVTAVWRLIDSDGNKKSLNGTWYLADEFVKLEQGMNIRVGTTILEVNMTN